MRYLVVGLVGASVSEVVEADTPEEAIDKAELSASICHHCSRDLSVGDVEDIEVIEDEGAGEVVHSDRMEREAATDARVAKVIADWIRKHKRARISELADAIERCEWRPK